MRCDIGLGSPAILESFGESFHGLSEEARTRGFASLALARFAFIGDFAISVVYLKRFASLYLKICQQGMAALGH